MFLFFWQDWQEFVYDLILVLMGIWSERLRQWWRGRDRNPWRYDCLDCRNTGAGDRFYASSNDIESLDELIKKHQQVSHSGS